MQWLFQSLHSPPPFSRAHFLHLVHFPYPSTLHLISYSALVYCITFFLLLPSIYPSYSNPSLAIPFLFPSLSQIIALLPPSCILPFPYPSLPGLPPLLPLYLTLWPFPLSLSIRPFSFSLSLKPSPYLSLPLPSFLPLSLTNNSLYTCLSILSFYLFPLSLSLARSPSIYPLLLILSPCTSNSIPSFSASILRSLPFILLSFDTLPLIHLYALRSLPLTVSLYP